MSGVLNYTTSISSEKTIGEMQRLLAQAGASQISIDFQDGNAVGIGFMLVTPLGPRSFQLPVDVEAMMRLLVSQWNQGKLRSGGGKAKMTGPEQAEKVAWRVMKDWLAAQLALVATQMASIDQVMLPYLVVAPHKTLYGAFREKELGSMLELQG